jgi:hypothetical protein
MSTGSVEACGLMELCGGGFRRYAELRGLALNPDEANR